MPKLDRPRIKPLPPLLVNQLAAGEIVTRPASVVKELVENAIDAGATRIVIRVTQGGTGLIEVADNGCGIHPDDMIMAVTRFATSKIADVANLQGIRTLGFRGEALASTAAVSRLTLVSSHDDSGVGRKLIVAGILDDAPVLTPIVHPQGTTVTVKDLYFNVPARRGNLKSIATEFAHIEAVIQGLAIAVSHIDIELWHNDKIRYDFKAIKPQSLNEHYQLDLQHSADKDFVQQILQRLSSIDSQFNVGDRLCDGDANIINSDCILPLHVDLSGLNAKQNPSNSHESITPSNTANRTQIQGVVFITPKLDGVNNKSNLHSLPKLIYINGRLVKDALIAQHLRNIVSFISPTNSHRTDGNCLNSQPVAIEALGYVLFFNLPLAWLNVNVHPSKQRIDIGHLSNILAHLNVTLTSRLQAWQRDFKFPSHKLKNNFTSNTPSLADENERFKQTDIDTSQYVQKYFDNENTRGLMGTMQNPELQLASSFESGQADSGSKVAESVQAYEINGHEKTHNHITAHLAEQTRSYGFVTPRAVMLFDRAKIDELGLKVHADKRLNASTTKCVDSMSDMSNNDKRTNTYLLLQDSKGLCVVNVSDMVRFLRTSKAFHKAASLSLSSDTDLQMITLQVINSQLANCFYQNADTVGCDVNNEWQAFVNSSSVVHLNHEQLLPLLFGLY